MLFLILGGQKKKNPTETPKPTPPFSTAGIQDELEFRGRTSLFGGGIKGRIAGRGDLSEDAEISAAVSHAVGQLQRRHLTDTNNEDLTGVTTTPRGKRRDKCEVQNKAESDLLEEERIICQQL